MLPLSQPGSPNSLHHSLEPISSNRLSLKRLISFTPSLGTPSCVSPNLEQPRHLASLVSDRATELPQFEPETPRFLSSPWILELCLITSGCIILRLPEADEIS